VNKHGTNDERPPDIAAEADAPETEPEFAEEPALARKRLEEGGADGQTTWQPA
jgi:hypothetical protein